MGGVIFFFNKIIIAVEQSKDNFFLAISVFLPVMEDHQW